MSNQCSDCGKTLRHPAEIFGGIGEAFCSSCWLNTHVKWSELQPPSGGMAAEAHNLERAANDATYAADIDDTIAELEDELNQLRRIRDELRRGDA